VSPSTFYIPTAKLRSGEVSLQFSGAEARHAIAVHRCRVGEVIDLVDGNGLRARVQVHDIAAKDAMTCTVLELIEEPEMQPRVTVIQALIKDGELAVDLLSQAGVEQIVPWAAERSVVQWRGARMDKARSKWINAAAVAAKQSRRAWWPEVTEIESTSQVCAWITSASLAILLDPDADEAIGDVQVPQSGEIVIVVGPEGGMSRGETDAFTSAGARPVRLGPTMFRSATAGMAAVVGILLPSARWNPARD
jgi:16S rRNA (uracil1498-N3)-methyltransferase